MKLPQSCFRWSFAVYVTACCIQKAFLVEHATVLCDTFATLVKIRVCVCVSVSVCLRPCFVLCRIVSCLSLEGPSAMSYESRVRTPAVPFGDKFEVVTQYGLVKEGPEKVSHQPALHTIVLHSGNTHGKLGLS